MGIRANLHLDISSFMKFAQAELFEWRIVQPCNATNRELSACANFMNEKTSGRRFGRDSIRCMVVKKSKPFQT